MTDRNMRKAIRPACHNDVSGAFAGARAADAPNQLRCEIGRMHGA